MASVEEQAEIAKETQKSGSRFLEKIEHMRSVAKQHKRNTLAVHQKCDWIREAVKLRSQLENVEKEMNRMLVTSDEKNPEDTVDSMEECFLKRHEQYVDMVEQVKVFQEQRESLKGILENILLVREEYEEKEGCLEDDREGSGVCEGSDIWMEEMKEQLMQLVKDSITGQEILDEQLQEQYGVADMEYMESYRYVLSVVKDGSLSEIVTTKGMQSCEELIDSVGGRTCPNEILKLEATIKLQRMIAHHHKMLANLKNEFVVKMQDTMQMDEVKVFSKIGGWNEMDHARYMKVYKECQPAGIKDVKFIQRLKLALPKKMPAVLVKHDKWYRSVRVYNDQRKDLCQTHERKLHAYAEEMRKEFRDALEAHKEYLLQQETQKMNASKCASLHDKLANLQNERDARDRIIQQQQQLKKESLEQQAAIAERKRLESEKRKKMLIVSFRESMALQRQIQDEIEAEELKRKNALLEEQAKINAERSEFRAGLLDEKKKCHLQQMEAKQAELEKQQEAVAAIAKQTPYAERIANLEHDFERVRAPTAAFSAICDPSNLKLGVNETGLFPSHGYDCDKLFKDARFKLGIALRNAGLHTSGLAMAAMSKVQTNNTTGYRHVAQKTTQLW